ncbi:MAG TPA: hypothetical protein VMT31_05710 [Methanomicrobiales archaeon]|nr:hypothetical protein [Methanomicrobiales archaeon]
MKSRYTILICALALLCLVQAGAALTYEGTLVTTPTAVNALKPGDGVAVTGVIKLPTSGDQTFASQDNLEFYTQLDKPKWAVVIRASDGREVASKDFGGKRAVISGWELAYPMDNYEGGLKVEFSLTDGTIPSSFTSGDIILFRAQELDSSDNPVGASVTKNGTVVNLNALKDQVAAVRVDLANLKTAIDQKVAMGVDVTKAQQKYNAANTALTSAANKIDTSPSEVSGLIQTATTAIQDGNSLLDQAWADQSIQKARTMLTSVDGLITEFIVNDSLKESDPRLVPIINKRDLAAQAIGSANDLFTSGSYPSARGKANDGYSLANQAWNLSLSLKEDLDKGFALPGLPSLGALLIPLLVAAVILAIGGVIIYRRKMHWDELG